MGALSRLIFGIPIGETSCERRGFRGGDAVARARFEQIGRSFVHGYHAALEEPRLERLTQRLGTVEPETRGFAFEGVAMGLALLDALEPWRRSRWQSLLDGPGGPHAYMVHVGAGWALARLGGRPERFLPRPDPLLRWLVLDGFGFHEGYFHWPKSVEQRAVPARLAGYERRAFDQGLGRSLWFVEGGEPPRLERTIASFEPARRADLWSGVGLAAAYAGGVSRAALEQLGEASGDHAGEVAQGAAFAAKARERAGLPAPHTESACQALCGMSAREAAALCDQTLRDLPADGVLPAFEHWRARLRARLSPAPALGS